MKALILGDGNLGNSLNQAYIQHYNTPLMFSRSTGTDVSNITNKNSAGKNLGNILEAAKYDVIWYCVGGGSVEEAEHDPELSYKLNVEVPYWILINMPVGKKLVVFSSDYVSDANDPTNPYVQCAKPRSRYAEQKIMLENLFLKENIGGTCVMRIGSLYGTYKPLKTFPGKILNKYQETPDEKIAFPRNLITPTSTRWLAGVLMENAEALFDVRHCQMHHCAPTGNTTVLDWAQRVLAPYMAKSQYKQDYFFDTKRPLFSHLGCSFLHPDQVPHWAEIWRRHYRDHDYSSEVRERYFQSERQIQSTW